MYRKDYYIYIYKIYKKKYFPLNFLFLFLNFILHGIRAYLLKLNPNFFFKSLNFFIPFESLTPLKSKTTMSENTTIVSHGAPTFIQTLQDNSPFPTGIILDDTNYPLWSQLMEMRIGARNKSGFITGTTFKPPTRDKVLETWLIDNSQVKSWLIDSMSPMLMQRFIRLQTTKEIWDAISKNFYDESNET